MSDLITAEDAWKLLDEVAQNQPRVCLAWCLKSAEDCLCYKAKIAEGALYKAAPDLARTVIALHADRERFSQGIRRLTAENERLREELANVLGHVDTPISRRRLGFDPDTCVWLLSARAALKGEQK